MHSQSLQQKNVPKFMGPRWSVLAVVMEEGKAQAFQTNRQTETFRINVKCNIPNLEVFFYQKMEEKSIK